MKKKLLAVVVSAAFAAPALAFAQSSNVVTASGKPVIAAGQAVTFTGKGDPGIIPAGPASGNSPK
jgi:hypothetical protein